MALSFSFNVGTNALPKISQVISLMKARRGVEWTTEDQLPLEVEVPPQHRYHSVFICPVLRQQTTPENPPMMMICGHVICKEALTRLSKGNPNLYMAYILFCLIFVVSSSVPIVRRNPLRRKQSRLNFNKSALHYFKSKKDALH